MHVSRVAYDRFVLEVPLAEPGWEPLADPTVAHDVSGWLWEFGPTPLIAIVEGDRDVPPWLSDRTTFRIPWKGTQATALILEERTDLERFVREAAPLEGMHLLWPRVSPAKTFEALCAAGDTWTRAVDAHARVTDGNVEVLQLQPV